MGMYCDVSTAAEPSKSVESRREGYSENHVSLEKAWHALHYLLSGDVWEGAGPQAFLLAGGEPIGEDEEAQPRWFSQEETRQIHAALSAVSDDQLWSRFDADELERLEIYPGIWDEPEDDLKDEYLTYFHELQRLVASAVHNDQGLIVSLG